MALEGRNPETVLWHRKKLPAFAQFLQQQGHALKVKDLGVEDARAFIKSLLERKTRYSAHVLRKEVERNLAMTAVVLHVRCERSPPGWNEKTTPTETSLKASSRPSCRKS